jgi:hypothetical protein
MRILDLNGRLIRSLKTQETQTGIYEVRIPVDGLSSGTYLLHIESEKDQSHLPFVKE